MGILGITGLAYGGEKSIGNRGFTRLEGQGGNGRLENKGRVKDIKAKHASAFRGNGNIDSLKERHDKAFKR